MCNADLSTLARKTPRAGHHGLYRAKTRCRSLTRYFLGGLGCSPVLVDYSAEDLLTPDRGVEGDHRRP